MIVREISTYTDEAARFFRFLAERPFLDVANAVSLSERFRRIKHNYKIHQEAVDLGISSWDDEPYDIANWLVLFTPIEMAAWTDIRGAGLPLWPQLPVGRFFVDFGNPIKKVALECDGKEWHNPAKDALRDAELAQMGWVVIRAEGWRCNRIDDDNPDQTMRPVINNLKRHFE